MSLALDLKLLSEAELRNLVFIHRTALKEIREAMVDYLGHCEEAGLKPSKFSEKITESLLKIDRETARFRRMARKAMDEQQSLQNRTEANAEYWKAIEERNGEESPFSAISQSPAPLRVAGTRGQTGQSPGGAGDETVSFRIPARTPALEEREW